MAYEQTGRTHQKRRTRKALVAAARELVADGKTPTVEEAAAAARVSRTTAYRYFPSQRDLLVAAHPEIDMPSLLPEGAPEDPEQRLDAVISAITAQVAQNEAQQRTMLRLSLEATPEERARLVLRQGRAIGWVTEALEPLRDRLGDDELERLVLAVRSAIGIEAFVWLVDVAGQSRDEAVATMRWSGAALLRAALADEPVKGSRGARPARAR
jgi:AcrR family transcriptional regulator